MEEETSKSRVSKVLEQQLGRCNEVLSVFMENGMSRGFDEYRMRNLLGLAKVSAQLAAVIGRLDNATGSKNSQNRGSNPQ